MYFCIYFASPAVCPFWKGVAGIISPRGAQAGQLNIQHMLSNEHTYSTIKYIVSVRPLLITYVFDVERLLRFLITLLKT